MKCRLSSEFKTLSFKLAIVTVAIVSITSIIIGLVSGIGYIAFHWFDVSLAIKVVEGPFEYYLKQGIILSVIIVGLILLLILFYSLVLYPLYYLIFNFKKVLNFIFDCKGN